MNKRLTIWIALSFLFVALPAQNKWNAQVMKHFSDTLQEISSSYFAYYNLWDDPNAPAAKWVKPNPYCYKLFVPPTYYEAPIRQAFSFEWEPSDRLGMNSCDSVYMARPDTLPKYKLTEVKNDRVSDRWINRILMNFYLENPELVMGNELYFADVKALDEEQVGRAPRKENVKEYMQVINPVETADAEVDVKIMKPNFWKKTAYASIHYNQNAISDNWYQGGESTNALVSELRLTANYDDKQRVQFDNLMEIKLGFITAPSDTMHHYKTNADLFHLKSKLGVKAFNRWYYTFEADFKTQFFPNYKTNTNDLISSFLSPATLDLSLGMDYKLNKKNVTLSVMAAPLTYKFVYLKNDSIINPSSFSVDPGHSSANLFGSKVEANLTWQISKDISLRSKVDYFTTYEKVVANWENTFEFKLNRYLSTKLFLHARFDDGVTLKEEDDTYFQFKEMLTFGLAYTW